jgi:signal transduction histidine kinase
VDNVISLRSMKEPSFIIVNNGVVVEISQSFSDMTEYSNKQLLYKKIEDVFSILRVGPHINFEDIDEDEDYFLFTKFHEVRLVEIELSLSAKGRVFSFIEKPNSRFDIKFPLADKLCADNHHGIAIFSLPDITLLKANEVFIGFFDEPYNKKENCIGKTVKEFVTGFKGSASEKIWETIIATGKTFNIEEYMFDRFERGVTYWRSTMTPIYENGKLKYCIEMTTDITEQVLYRKKIEEQAEIIAKQNELLEKTIDMKDEFLSIISHEFRTPLNVIDTAIQAMSCIYKDELSDKVKEYIKMIRQNTYRQLRLVNNLLDITRANAGRIKIHKKNIDIVFLTKAITESVCDYAAQKGVNVTFEASFKKKIIGIDDEKYERILLNILSNAIKFTPQDKCINVKMRTIKKNICIEVKDSGIGIPKDKIDLIFERFGQVDSSLSRHAEGAGIGLSLVSKFTEALGGSISVKSKVGRGSTFSILLPDEKIENENNEEEARDLMDNRLVQVSSVEFSDIYL